VSVLVAAGGVPFRWSRQSKSSAIFSPTARTQRNDCPWNLLSRPFRLVRGREIIRPTAAPRSRANTISNLARARGHPRRPRYIFFIWRHRTSPGLRGAARSELKLAEWGTSAVADHISHELKLRYFSKSPYSIPFPCAASGAGDCNLQRLRETARRQSRFVKCSDPAAAIPSWRQSFELRRRPAISSIARPIRARASSQLRFLAFPEKTRTLCGAAGWAGSAPTIISCPALLRRYSPCSFTNRANGRPQAVTLLLLLKARQHNGRASRHALRQPLLLSIAPTPADCLSRKTNKEARRPPGRIRLGVP